MKPNKRAIISVIAVTVLLCISIGIIIGKPNTRKAGYSAVADDNTDADYPDSTPAKTMSSPDGTISQGSDDVVPQDADFHKRKKAKLTDQNDGHGEISDKVREKLLDGFISQKPIVILDCPGVTPPKKMKKYQKRPVRLYSNKNRKKLSSLLRQTVMENPYRTAYQPVWLPDDYDYEAETGNSYNDLLPSIKQPYTITTPTGSDSFILNKEWYDTDVRTEDCFFLSRKRVVKKTEKFLKLLKDKFDLGCELTPPDTWKILGYTWGDNSKEGALAFPYRNHIQEDYYAVTAYCSLDGYTVIGDIGEEAYQLQDSNYFMMYYSESGWRYINCEIPHAFRDTGKYYDNILPLEKVRKKLQNALKKDGRSVAYGVSEAQIGYAATEKELRPVWILYGEKKCVGGSRGRYIVDAVTGQTLSWQAFWE